MLGQEKNIKGFNLLELIVVIAIIGAISAAAYPNFSKWSKERKVRYGTEKLLRVLKDIKVQTDRSTFAYVQVLFTNDEKDELTIETKGMTMQTLATKMNNGADEWNTSPQLDVILDQPQREKMLIGILIEIVQVLKLRMLSILKRFLK